MYQHQNGASAPLGNLITPIAPHRDTRMIWHPGRSLSAIINSDLLTRSRELQDQTSCLLLIISRSTRKWVTCVFHHKRQKYWLTSLVYQFIVSEHQPTKVKLKSMCLWIFPKTSEFQTLPKGQMNSLPLHIAAIWHEVLNCLTLCPRTGPDYTNDPWNFKDLMSRHSKAVNHGLFQSQH